MKMARGRFLETIKKATFRRQNGDKSWRGGGRGGDLRSEIKTLYLRGGVLMDTKVIKNRGIVK